MRAAVVYESMFGNTRQVAKAVAAELSQSMEVEMFEVGEAPSVIDKSIGLVVVGAPTHAFSLSRSSTRREAALTAPRGLVSTQIGAREWLESVEAVPGTPAIAFDTRMDSRFAGHAARAATRRLRKAGFSVLASPASFLVEHSTGPLSTGELDRAHVWAAELAAATAAVTS
ncbi:flavodoxin family protein [Glycomyces harbinensis]|uniref:Flavodoxin-like domain-containing protein n=1 Tax=Glycomyces harbinensis TaxID=58114 RepID=A0A1G6XMF6_9ACTN|nr:flavodoxin family protein [Glycomyces harbinensis]SDD78933.1 hypothetical protein SAMN05216270_107233 [Glycomyces harbinensis]